MGKVIQEHYGAECTNHDLPCPVLYNSAESYKCKFKKCFKKKRKARTNLSYKINVCYTVRKKNTNYALALNHYIKKIVHFTYFFFLL